LTAESPLEIQHFESHWNLVCGSLAHVVTASRAPFVFSPESDAGGYRALPVRLHLALGVLVI
jgi:hypothetical protein